MYPDTEYITDITYLEKLLCTSRITSELLSASPFVCNTMQQVIISTTRKYSEFRRTTMLINIHMTINRQN